MSCVTLPFTHFVTPAKAGVHLPPYRSFTRGLCKLTAQVMDSRLRGNDEREGCVPGGAPH
jgi:hypothetical protein